MKSIVEDAALEWFGELGYAIGHGPQMAPGKFATERDSFSVVVLVVRLREALLSGELGMACLNRGGER